MGIKKDLPELVESGTIDQETADRILAWYKQKSGPSTNRLLIAFGVLGAALVGLGLILIIAHNWDNLSRPVKTIFAFLPLIAGQAAALFTILKKKDSIAWREGSSTFLIFAVGACISLISQIYNLPGDLASFMLTWSLLSLPVMYVMRSSMASLLYIVGATIYGCEAGYWSHPEGEAWLFILLLIPAIPHYYLLLKNNPESNFTLFHNWFYPLALIINLGVFAQKDDEIMFIAYFALFGLLMLIGNLDLFSKQKIRNNGYMILGALGTIVLMLTFSFGDMWDELNREEYFFSSLIQAPELWISIVLTIAAAVFLVINLKKNAVRELNPLGLFFLLFPLMFMLDRFVPVSAILMNLLILALSIFYIYLGAKRDNLGILNIGLLLITALITCRFFDTDLSFVLRGILFLIVGSGFFVANYLMLKRRKNDE